MGQYGFTGPAGMSAAGVPLDSRGAWYSHCGWDNARSATPDVGSYKTTQFGGHFGGSRKQRKQRGGSCACSGITMPPAIAQQKGGGGGAGGYSTILSNDLGKVHAGFAVAPCPPAPRENQVGGASSPEQIVSYTTGFGYSPSSVVSTSSAHYLNQQAYNKTCSGGARRTRKSRKSRRHH